MKTLFFALLSLVIVDRVAVSVGTRVITASEIELRIRLTALENKDTPVFDRDTRRAAVQRLIDQKLVEREMDVGRYPRTKSSEAKHDVDAALLARYSVTQADLDEDLARQADLLTFLNLRFRADSAERADSEMERWLKDQRRQTKIVYLDKDLAP